MLEVEACQPVVGKSRIAADAIVCRDTHAFLEAAGVRAVPAEELR